MTHRLTYDATLAELTSLEEMLRSMMDDGQIHPDVVTKLWEVYSQSFLFKPQSNLKSVLV
jgi:hypothetical protein